MMRTGTLRLGVRTAIVAGHHRHAYIVANHYNIAPRDWFYATDDWALCGVDPSGLIIYIYDTAAQNPRHPDIERRISLLEARGALVRYVTERELWGY